MRLNRARRTIMWAGFLLDSAVVSIGWFAALLLAFTGFNLRIFSWLLADFFGHLNSATPDQLGSFLVGAFVCFALWVGFVGFMRLPSYRQIYKARESQS